MPRLDYESARRMQISGRSQELLECLNPGEVENVPRLRLLRGIALALTGRRDEARAWLETSYEPSTGPELSDLGLARLLIGDLEGANNLLEKALQCYPEDSVTHGRMAAARLARGDLAAAEVHYLEAVNREPGRAEWHNNLAGILVRQQKLEQALEHYAIALSLKPDLEQSQKARQHVLIALERTEELVAELQREIVKKPDDHNLKLRLARAYNLDNRPAEAIRLLRKELAPIEEIERGSDGCRQQYDLRSLMAEIFADRSMHPRALAVLKEMEELAPENPVPVICRQAVALTELGRHDAALEKLDALEKDFPDNNQLKTTRANVLCEKGDYDQAEGILRDLLKVYPGDANLLTQLGQTLLWVGDLDEAARCFERASAINPMALAQMVNARKIPDDPKALEKMRSVARNPLIPEAPRQSMHFALSTVCEKQKDYDGAFGHLRQANRLVDKGLKYNPEIFTKKTEAVARVFGRDFFDRLKPIRSSDRTPIFVVGMPRSGTTLTEQILSSHPDIFGAGELPIIPRLTGLLPRVLKVRQPFPGCVAGMNPHLREEAARHYLYSLYEYDRDHPFVVDKMPHNFVNLGLIAMILPKARIVHVNRDPRDTAVSNYQQNFKAKHGGMGYAFDLKNIACQINDYWRLMNHWRETLPLPIFDLSYEAMVEDMENTARQVLDFVGVGWHEEVTRFYDTKRAVRTASVSQVRQPIYKTSMKKWKRYEAHLGELMENLDPEVTAGYDHPTADNNPYESRIVCRGNVARLA